MSTSGVTGRWRWRLPARRKRWLSFAVPASFLVIAAALSLLGDVKTGIGLGLGLAGTLWSLSVTFVRFEDTPEPPDPRTLQPDRSERRHLASVVRERRAIDADEAARLRPLAEQTGRQAARGVLTGSAFLLLSAGFLVTVAPRWYAILWAIIIPIYTVLVLQQLRDRRVYAEFLDRY